MAKLTHLIGIIKDKASQSKAALLSQRTTLSLLRATTHDSSTPPTRNHLHTLLSSADGSRATAAAFLELLIDRLNATHHAAVALKCLLVVHHIARRGTFILQDQLSVYPSSGGRNHLSLSNFRRRRSTSDPTSWQLSSWVRWFATHVEHLLCASRALGFFLGPTPRSDTEEKVSALATADLLTELESLVALVEGLCERPEPNGNGLVEEIVGLARGDWAVVEREVRVRVGEFKERVEGLKFGEAVELFCCMKRLEECEDKMVGMIEEARELVLWDLVREVKDKARFQVYRDDEPNSKLRKQTTMHLLTHSHRFSPTLLTARDFLRFPSGRDNKPMMIYKCSFITLRSPNLVVTKSENRIMPDGVNAKLLGCHGPLANRQPGRAFLSNGATA
ncbi:hypothetical protein Fmac_004384 [Flemingia macrophylla]|uniref:ENTH domain-containing protein n=1 Tax=Flemingia macrophylla TaxID=520843 RepID=A0ABD1N4S0_9FABA